MDGLSAGCSIKNAKKQKTTYKNVRRKTYIAHKQYVKVKLLNLINVKRIICLHTLLLYFRFCCNCSLISHLKLIYSDIYHLSTHKRCTRNWQLFHFKDVVQFDSTIKRLFPTLFVWYQDTHLYFTHAVEMKLRSEKFYISAYDKKLNNFQKITYTQKTHTSSTR